MPQPIPFRRRYHGSDPPPPVPAERREIPPEALEIMQIFPGSVYLGTRKRAVEPEPKPSGADDDAIADR